MIQTSPIDRDTATGYWQRITDGLDGTTFGPDFDATKPPGEAWWELRDGDEVIGLGWARRFLKSGGIINQGQALFPEARGSQRGLVPTSEALAAAVWTHYPQAKTIIVVVWSTNPSVLRRVAARRRQIGMIPHQGCDMYIFLIEERTGQ